VAVHAQRLNLLDQLAVIVGGVAICCRVQVGNLASDGLEELGRVLGNLGCLLIGSHVEQAFAQCGGLLVKKKV
jgi:hypothetical protein